MITKIKILKQFRLLEKEPETTKNFTRESKKVFCQNRFCQKWLLFGNNVLNWLKEDDCLKKVQQANAEGGGEEGDQQHEEGDQQHEEGEEGGGANGEGYDIQKYEILNFTKHCIFSSAI